ncbi:MAG: hypothetical protein K5979_07565 [Ruminococcus sp.]|nr:hypothetical protein [Ruminococcus sp.]
MLNVKKEQLTDKNAALISYKDIYFVAVSETGSMGDNGSITIVSLENREIIVRRGSYIDGSLDYENVIKAFPPIKDFDFEKPKSTDNWKAVYMGAGNHLFVRQDIYPDFDKKIKHSGNPVQKVIGLFNGTALLDNTLNTYSRWLETSIAILNEKV